VFGERVAMRNVFLIAYDICDDQRYRRIYKHMCGAGDPLQYSVFRCALTLVELQRLKDQVWPLMKQNEDRVMIVNLGPSDGRGDACIECWGKPLTEVAERKVQIV
jgi:CRISPR-associated protein Cas2